MDLEHIKQKLSVFFHSQTDLAQAQKDSSYLKNIIDNVPLFLVWKDTHSVFLGCNKKFAYSVSLASPQEIVGKTDYDFPWTDEQRIAYIADEQEIIRTGKPKLDYEEVQTQRDGSNRIMLVNKVPMYNDKSQIIGVLIVYSDITERKLLEENLKREKEKAENANKAKTEFIRNISHDVRTPLSGIQQITRLIVDGNLSETDITQYASDAMNASDQLMRLLNQIIDVSKKESFDYEDRIEKFDLKDLIESLKESYEPLARYKNINLEIECTHDVPNYLIGKHYRLHRVLMNLIGNALKFTEKGNVKLIVEQAKQLKKEVVLRFSVVDTGIGIPSEKIHIIFEPFSRLNPSFEGKYEGSGLGLYMVKDYIEKMNGEIHVESREGHGSIFSCLIPFKRPLLEDDNDVPVANYEKQISLPKALEKNDKSEKSSLSSHVSNGYKVLLVEDTEIPRKTGSLILKNMGYEVDVAESGEQALTMTQNKAYDLIYLDIGLPGINGIETAKKIRSDSKNKNQNILIVALTAHADEAINQEALASGMQKVLSKPLSNEKANEIHSLLLKPKNKNIKNDVVDFELWHSRLGDNKEILEEIFHTLGKEFDENKQQIELAYNNRDLPTLKAVTHKLKGALSYCGFPRLETAIKAIESAAKESNQTEVKKWYPKVIKAINEAKDAYKEWAKTHPTIPH